MRALAAQRQGRRYRAFHISLAHFAAPSPPAARRYYYQYRPPPAHFAGQSRRVSAVAGCRDYELFPRQQYIRVAKAAMQTSCFSQVSPRRLRWPKRMHACRGAAGRRGAATFSFPLGPVVIARRRASAHILPAIKSPRRHATVDATIDGRAMRKNRGDSRHRAHASARRSRTCTRRSRYF